MRVGWWWLVLLLSGCSGGYPLEPTPCDDLCHVTQGPGCAADYEPASCVVTCERGDLDAPPCRSLFDGVIACFRENPRAAAQRCDYFTPYDQRDCQAQQEALAFCVNTHGVPDYY
jgi:hypothetical protein